MAWEVYRKSIEWEEVQRNPVTKPTVQDEPTTKKPPLVTRVCSRNRFVLRNCTNLVHMLTLSSQGVKPGHTTICGECSQEISWNGVK